MTVNVARNGVNIGSFELDELKRMADAGTLLQTDHVYLPAEGRWEQINKVPDMQAKIFPLAHLFEPAVPAPRITGTPETFETRSSATAADSDMELVQGYPKCFWKAYFGKNAYWYLDKIKGLPTLQEEQDFQASLKSKNSDGKSLGLLERQEKQKAYGEKHFRPSLYGFLFGWFWLAYRKSGVVFVIYPILSLLIGLLGLLIGDKGDDAVFFGRLWVVQIIAFTLWPCLEGVSILHRRAQVVFRDVCKETSVHAERLGRIQERGGTSVSRLAGFVCFVIAYEWVLDAIFS